MKRKLSIGLSILFIAISVIALADGPYPSVGLYWYDSHDPTSGAGMTAPLNQLLVRTDSPSLYYKSGGANTAWTRIGTGTSSGGTVTSITCSTGLSCTATNPITTSGTVAVNLTPTTCAASSAVSAIASNGTGSCTAFLTSASLTTTDQNHLYVSDDFYNAGDNTFTSLWSTGGGGTDTDVGGTSNHPGIREICTTTTRKSIFSAAGNFDTWVPGGGVTDMIWGLRLPVISDGTDTYIAYVGTTTTVSGAPTRGVYCQAAQAASANWQACTTQASVSTCVDTSPIVPIVSNHWVRCAWEVNAGGTSVAFTIADTTASITGTATNTTNIPAALSAPAAYIVKSAGTNSRCIDLDYYAMSETFTTAR